MGGHGGLNILPQKRWNVYRDDNREKVRKDEEAAGKEEELKREQSRKRDAEFRLERLRLARGIPPSASSADQLVDSKKSNSHINLFEGLKVFPSEDVAREEFKKNKKQKKEETAPKVVTPEDEKFRLGYGVAGKGVKAPWYLSRPSDDVIRESSSSNRDSTIPCNKDGVNNSGKKSFEELRQERFQREKREKERELALLHKRGGAVSKGGGFHRY